MTSLVCVGTYIATSKAFGNPGDVCSWTVECQSNLPYSFFATRNAGELIFRLSATNMLQKSILMTLISMVIFIINFVFALLLQPKLSQCMNHEMMERSKSQSLQIESLYSINSIKACNEVCSAKAYENPVTVGDWIFL